MAESLPSDPRAEARAGSRVGYRWFGAGVGSWFMAWGMQSVLFSWIVVGELQAPAEWVGFAQSASMLPGLLLLIPGGALADRVDPRRLLIGLHAVAAVPALLLAFASATGALSLPLLIAFGLSIGTVSAFAMPARDALLSRVAGDDMMHAVTGMTATQFGAQALGSLTAGLARTVGSAPMLVVQSLVLLVGSIVTTRLPAAQPSRPAEPEPAWREITAGLPVVLRTPNLRWPFLMVISVGTFFIGPFMVCFPLMVRDVYGGDAGSLAVVLMLFPIGTIAGSLLIRARGGIARKGQAALIALILGAATLFAIGVGLPFWAMIVCTLLWGLAGSVFINCNRTMFQEAAPPEQRARVLAFFQLGFIGAAPIGATAAGIASGSLGVLATMRSFSLGMALFVIALALFTNVRRMR